LKTFALRASEKKLELLYEVDDEVPEIVRGDENKLRQILVNLLGNAIKFTHAGEVGLRVKIDKVEDKKYLLRFTVSDTGVGLAADVRKLIFDPFTQADNSTTKNYGGTGLGLAISARLVKMMGGEIWVESEPGRGSQFHFTAQLAGDHEVVGTPLAEVAPAAQPDSAPARGLAPSLRVLLAEDNAVNRKVVTSLLEKRGHQVLVATTGKEALAALEKGTFDLVLMDVQMPEMDGFEATRRIRLSEQGTAFHQWIIALTAYAMSSDRTKCLEAGMDGYLTKPLSALALDQVLESYRKREEVHANELHDHETA
jgi:CheY-like chemotaxis protein/anti-sigma regulatory factor (Ser/Thr protein kinase)